MATILIHNRSIQLLSIKDRFVCLMVFNNSIQSVWLVGFMVFNATLNTISAISWRVSFIGGGNRSTRRKPPTCRKSLTNFITYNVVLLALSGGRTHNISGDRHRLHR